MIIIFISNKKLFLAYGIFNLIYLILQIVQVLKIKPKYQKQIDRELLKCFTSNYDKMALNELFKRYTHLVASIALGILKDEQKAKLAIFNIFKSITIDLKNHDIKNFNAWIFNVTKRYCFKVKNIENGIEYRDDIDEILEKELLLQKHNEILKNSMQEINVHEKTCIDFFYSEGLNYSEITEKTGFSIEQVKSHIQNGKKNIKLLIYNNEKQ